MKLKRHQPTIKPNQQSWWYLMFLVFNEIMISCTHVGHSFQVRCVWYSTIYVAYLQFLLWRKKASVWYYRNIFLIQNPHSSITEPLSQSPESISNLNAQGISSIPISNSNPKSPTTIKISYTIITGSEKQIVNEKKLGPFILIGDNDSNRRQ